MAVTAVALLIAAPASARIVPGKSIAGIELEMTRGEIVAKKGKPDAERVVDHEITGKQRIMRYGKTRVGIARHSGAIFVTTTDPKQRTRKGIGVGSRLRAVKRKVNRVKCERAFGVIRCTKGKLEPGQRVTDFIISKKTRLVRRASVGIVID